MLLDARDLHIAYGDIGAVNGVNFYLEKGRFVSVILKFVFRICFEFRFSNFEF